MKDAAEQFTDSAPSFRGLWRVLGMISAEERECLAQYGRDQYQGSGEIVDLGCWLGCTTTCLLIGLSENSHFAERGPSVVHAYDSFVWREWMNHIWKVQELGLHEKYQPGDCFLEEFHAQTREHAGHIVAHKANLEQESWAGGDIEFLLLDAMKTDGIARAIERNFFPSLLPGALIFHQDFCWCNPYVHWSWYHHRNSLEIVFDVANSGATIFRLSKPITEEDVQRVPSLYSVREDVVEQAIRTAAEVVRPESRYKVLSSLVKYYLERGNIERAEAELVAIEEDSLSTMTEHLEGILSTLRSKIDRDKKPS